jgi:hypothetical protein
MRLQTYSLWTFAQIVKRIYLYLPFKAHTGFAGQPVKTFDFTFMYFVRIEVVLPSR